MKKLILLLLFACICVSGGENTEVLTVKYDRDYYSPLGSVYKIDIILPQNPKRDFYLLELRFKGKPAYNFSETFAINTSGSIYLYTTKQHDQSGRLMENTSLDFSLYFNHQPRTYGFGFPNYQKMEFKIIRNAELKFDQLLELATVTDMSNKNKKLHRKYKLSLYLHDKQKDNKVISLLKKKEE
jgi:hypothetical protein